MQKEIEEIRNKQLEIEEMKDRKEKIKQLALEHRDTISESDMSEEKEKITKLNEEIGKREAELKEIKERSKKQGEQKMDENLFTDTSTRDDMISNFAKTRKLSIPNEEIRSTLLASAGIVKATKVNGIGDPFNTQISILDQVKAIDMTGAGTFKESFMKTHSSATTKTDGVAQTASDPTFGSVTISPSTVGVTSYISTEFRKVTPLNYAAKVQESALIGLKVKMAQDIVAKIKTATDDASAAMYSTLGAVASGFSTGTTSKVGAINEKTLRTIAMNYGGDANVPGNAVLYLNKTDLIAFGDVRGTNEKKSVYEITPNSTNPNIGIIKDGGLSVSYCIVPTLTALSGTAQTSTAIQTMIYGSPLNYELALFGNYEVRVSEDYKFAEGLDTILGTVTAGGNVIVPNGFVIVTIEATV